MKFKSLFIILILLALFVSSSYAATYVKEGFEGSANSGRENAGWVETGTGTFDFNRSIAADTNYALPVGAASECFRTSGSANAYIVFDFTGTTNNVASARSYVQVTSESLADTNLINVLVFRNTAGNIGLATQVYQATGGQLQLRTQYYTGSAFATCGSAANISTNIWYRIRIKLDLTNDLYACEICDVAGANCTSGNGSYTSTRQPNQVEIGANMNPAQDTITQQDALLVTDAYEDIADETDFSLTLTKLPANAAGSATNFSKYPDTGSNYEKVSCGTDAICGNSDDDTDYNYLIGTGTDLNDLYGVDTLTSGRGMILLVKNASRLAIEPVEADYPGRRLDRKFRSGTTTDSSSNIIDLPTAFTNVAKNYAEDPDTSARWRWSAVDGIEVGVGVKEGYTIDAEGGFAWGDFPSGSTWKYGGKIASAWAEVIHGSHLDRVASFPPTVTGVSDSALKVVARATPPPITGTTVYLRLRYSTSCTSPPNCTELAALGGTVVSAIEATSANNYIVAFGITGQAANTTFYIDLDTSPDGTTNWHSMNDLFGWGYTVVKTAPTWLSNTSFNLLVASDIHDLSIGDAFGQAASKNATIWINTGDFVDLEESDSLATRQNGYIFQYQTIRNLLNNIVMIGGVDDHETDDNANKTFTSTSMTAIEDMVSVYKQLRPPVEWPTENAAGQYGLWHSVKYGNTEFFILDLRSKRDPNGIFGADMMDGALVADTYYRLGQAGDVSGHASNSSLNWVSDATVDFLNAPPPIAEVGDVLVNRSDTERRASHIYSISETLFYYYPFTTYITGSDKWYRLYKLKMKKASGTITSQEQYKLIHETLGHFCGVDDNCATLGDNKVHAGDLVQNVNDAAWAFVKSVDSDEVLSLWRPDTGADVNIFAVGGGLDAYAIYESGASDHGCTSYPSNCANIDTNTSCTANETPWNCCTGSGTGACSNHRQREWLINRINTSEAIHKFINTSVPFNKSIYFNGMHDYDIWEAYDPYGSQWEYITRKIPVTTTGVRLFSGDVHFTGVDNGTNSHWPEYLITPLSVFDFESSGTWSETNCLLDNEGEPFINYFGIMTISGTNLSYAIYDHEGTMVCSYTADIARRIMLIH